MSGKDMTEKTDTQRAYANEAVIQLLEMLSSAELIEIVKASSEEEAMKKLLGFIEARRVLEAEHDE